MAVHEEARKPLQTYLNDHLAGAQAALDLMEDILEGAGDAEFIVFMRRLQVEVEEDRDQLEAIMERLGVAPQRLKQTLASVAESMSRLKLLRPTAGEALAQLLELETLSAGVWTKGRLWRSLGAAEGVTAALADIDLEQLAARAERQLNELEEHRLTAARRALAP